MTYALILDPAARRLAVRAERLGLTFAEATALTSVSPDGDPLDKRPAGAIADLVRRGALDAAGPTDDRRGYVRLTQLGRVMRSQLVEGSKP